MPYWALIQGTGVVTRDWVSGCISYSNGNGTTGVNAIFCCKQGCLSICAADLVCGQRLIPVLWKSHDGGSVKASLNIALSHGNRDTSVIAVLICMISDALLPALQRGFASLKVNITNCQMASFCSDWSNVCTMQNQHLNPPFANLWIYRLTYDWYMHLTCGNVGFALGTDRNIRQLDCVDFYWTVIVCC